MEGSSYVHSNPQHTTMMPRIEGSPFDERKESKTQLCAGSLVDRSRAFLGLCLACFLRSSLFSSQGLVCPPDSTGVGAEGLSLSRTKPRAPESLSCIAITPRFTGVPPYLSVLLFPPLNQLALVTGRMETGRRRKRGVMTASIALLVSVLSVPGPTGRNKIRPNIRGWLGCE